MSSKSSSGTPHPNIFRVLVQIPLALVLASHFLVCKISGEPMVGYSYQIFMYILLGYNKELIRFWWPWPNFLIFKVTAVEKLKTKGVRTSVFFLKTQLLVIFILFQAILIFWKKSSAETGARGHMQPCKLHCYHMKRLSEMETLIFILLCILCFQWQPLKIVFVIFGSKCALTLVMLNLDIPCLCKQCSSRSVGFWEANWFGSALFAIQYAYLYQ